jgi:hypothetical protein
MGGSAAKLAYTLLPYWQKKDDDRLPFTRAWRLNEVGQDLKSCPHDDESQAAIAIQIVPPFESDFVLVCLLSDDVVHPARTDVTGHSVAEKGNHASECEDQPDNVEDLYRSQFFSLTPAPQTPAKTRQAIFFRVSPLEFMKGGS